MGGRCDHWIEATADPLTDERFRVRFWSRVDTSGDCWLWQGAVCANGYGRFQTGSASARTHKTWIAHRFAYLTTVGPIPDGYHIDHLCRVRACVRPDHLEPVTPAENNRRARLYLARRVFCVHGHLKDEHPSGRRYCPTCDRDRPHVRRAA